MSRIERNGAVTVLAVVVGLTALLWLTSTPPARAASPVTQTFTPTGQSQAFTVPGGVTTLQITVRGGGGGAGFQGGSFGGGASGGAQVTGTLGVSPGQTLYADVGAAGGNATKPDGFCGFNGAGDVSQGGGGASAGIVNGGGDGGLGDLCGGGGGGGGGADTILMQNNGYAMSVDAGGGGGGGGGGGIAGFGGGGGGSAGPTALNGGAGSGPGHGSGGAGAGNPGSGGGLDGSGADNSSSAGGGGGGGGSSEEDGNGGNGGGGGAGGGGGGGAGKTFVANWISNVKISAGPAGAGGEVVISYTPPTSLGGTRPRRARHAYTIALKRCARTAAAAKRHCTTRLISAKFTFPIGTKDRLTLIRRGFPYAIGERRGKRIVLIAHRRVSRGRYTLIIAKKRSHPSIILRHRITIP